jgi:membrane protease YdiL (CAAX protease family)
MDSNPGMPGTGPETALVITAQEVSAPSPPLDIPPSKPSALINPNAENPPWTGIDLFVAAVAFVVSVFVASAVFLGIAVHAGAGSAAELAKNPTAAIVVPAMTLGYVVMLAVFYARVTSAQGLPFWKTIQWHWPQGYTWMAWVGAGAVMTMALGALSHFLPIPKSLPMERFFQNRQAVYLMMFMGVAVAPLTEEITFRGFLYPLLDRGLETMFMVRRQLLDACKWLVLAAGWGYLVHRLAEWPGLDRQIAQLSSILVALLLFLVIGVLFFVRWLRGSRAEVVLLAGLGLCVWGMMSRSLADRTFAYATLALAVLALVLGGTAVAGALSAGAAGRLGRFLAVLATAVAFAMVHSDQLADAWGPLLIILIVGLVLTITRVKTRSVAPGFLIHMAYNLTLFIGLYFQSDHLRHLERVSQ